MVHLHPSLSLSRAEADNTHGSKVTTLARGRHYHGSPNDQPISHLILFPRPQHRLQLIHRRQFHKKLMTNQ